MAVGVVAFLLRKKGDSQISPTISMCDREGIIERVWVQFRQVRLLLLPQKHQFRL